MTLAVTDQAGRHTATNLTVQVDPADSGIYVHTQFAGLFYSGVTVSNSFGVSAVAWGNAPTFVVGTLPGTTLAFQASPDGWVANASDMGAVPPGSILHVSANFTNWTIHATLPIDMVVTPSWMQSFLRVAGSSLRLEPSGSGPWNESYLMDCPMSWALGGLLQFGVPTPGFSGSYELLPVTTAEFNFTSSGNVSLIGFMSSSPSITLGPVTISAEWPGVTFSAFAVIGGSYATRAIGPHTYTVDWISAYTKAEVNVTASYTVDIFPAGTPEGEFGLSATISVSPSIAFAVVSRPVGPGPRGVRERARRDPRRTSPSSSSSRCRSRSRSASTISSRLDWTGPSASPRSSRRRSPTSRASGSTPVSGVRPIPLLPDLLQLLARARSTTGPGPPTPSRPAPGPIAVRRPALGVGPPVLQQRAPTTRCVWNTGATNGTAIEDIYPQADARHRRFGDERPPPLHVCRRCRPARDRRGSG